MDPNAKFVASLYLYLVLFLVLYDDDSDGGQAWKRYGRGLQMPGKSATIKIIIQKMTINSTNGKPGFKSLDQ